MREGPQARLARSRLNRLFDLIEARLGGGDLSLRTLAAEAGMHPHYLPRAFRRIVGQSPHQYVMTRRIERARRLLRDTDLTVAAIAAESGFSSQSHLCSHFKRATGVTPGEYRRCH
ncbi:MAG TPA: helix-turn-helix transcriptional regulator [Gammaproteobacteria bacterium]|nr:helix-turn-helix transcriptional regulator [Gammaproteobacteria bacterium]